MIDHATITSSADLEAVVGVVKAEGAFALDTEFMREKTYRARLCLVQIATNERIALIDPLAGVDVRPVADLIADPDVEVVLHAARQDLELFHDDFGVIPKRVFDVQVAAGFAGYGGSSSYGNLVRAVLDVTLTKGESYTDWCRRPLTEKQIRYAADDVRWLLEVAATLKSRLRELRRLEWVEEEMASLSAEETYEARPEDLWRRVSGRGTLSAKQLGVLQELARWRESEAARRDLPRGWILKDPTLVEIARRQPASTGALASIRGMNSKEVARSGRAILEAVERGRSNPPPEVTASPRRDDLLRARLIGGLADVVIRTRAEADGIAPELVATRGEVEALLLDLLGRDGAEPEGRHRLLRGWRRELAGAAVLGLFRGNLAIRATDRPPFVEEVPL